MEKRQAEDEMTGTYRQEGWAMSAEQYHKWFRYLSESPTASHPHIPTHTATPYVQSHH